MPLSYKLNHVHQFYIPSVFYIWNTVKTYLHGILIIHYEYTLYFVSYNLQQY